MSSTLHIHGLHPSVGEQQVKGLFAPCGNVMSVNIHRPQEASSLGFGLMEMASRRHGEPSTQKGAYPPLQVVRLLERRRANRSMP